MIRWIARGAALSLLAACTTVAEAPQALPQGKVSYRCDGGQALDVVYGTENGEPSVTLNIDGPEMLLAAPAERGRRYAWPSDGSYHIWQLDDQSPRSTGTLSYRDGEQGTTTPRMVNCRPV